MNKDTYSKEGSSCILTSGKNTSLEVSSEIESITNNFVQIKLTKLEEWIKYDENEHETSFNVICDLKLTRMQEIATRNTRERRETRPIKGGGPNDDFIYGGGVTIVNSTDIEINNVSVKWKKPPMTYDVRNILNYII